MEFALSEHSTGDAHVVAVQGELDLHTAPAVEAVLLPAITPASTVIADLSAVTFLDSTGHAVFVAAVMAAREQEARFALVATHPRVLKVLEITGFGTLAPVHDSLESALRG